MDLVAAVDALDLLESRKGDADVELCVSSSHVFSGSQSDLDSASAPMSLVVIWRLVNFFLQMESVKGARRSRSSQDIQITSSRKKLAGYL